MLSRSAGRSYRRVFVSARPLVVGATSVFVVPLRHARFATAPPLSILSWAVDGSLHTHQRCKRRLTLEERIPGIVDTIRQCAPDIVALQDSTPEVAEALCSCADRAAGTVATATVLTSLVQRHGDSAERWGSGGRLRPPLVASTGTMNRHDDAAAESVMTSSSEEVPNTGVALAPPLAYRLVGSARNGRCGDLQVFVKGASLWEAQLLPSAPFVTVELCYGAYRQGSDGKGVSGTMKKLPPKAPEDGVRVVLTTVDLSYRGRSLFGLSDAAVSLHGSPFTLAVPGEQPRRGKRDPGSLDPHREVALDFISRVTRPDVLIGNTFMGRSETMPGYDDAWVLAGSPAGQERTTNTCRTHRYDKETNYYYFVPTCGVGDGRGGRSMVHTTAVAKPTAATLLMPVAPLKGVPVGVPVSLFSNTVGGDHAATGSTMNSSFPSAAASSLDEFVTTQLQRETERAASQPPSPASDAPHAHRSMVGVPEVAGRFQRCFFRGSAANSSSQTHRSTYTFRNRFHRCRIVVPKPMLTVPVPIGPVEAGWHAAARRQDQSRRRDRHTVLRAAESADEAGAAKAPTAVPPQEEEATVDLGGPVKCSVSDQYPILVLLS